MDEQPINPINQTNAMLPAPKKPFWKVLWFKVAIGVILAVIFGVGIALASKIWDPLWNPFRPNPEKVLQKMFLNMQEISSLRADVEFRMDETDGKNFVTVKLSNSSDSADSQNSKSSGKISVGVGIQGVQLSGEADYLISGEDLYFRLSSLPTIPVLPIDLNSIQGKWIKGVGALDLSKSDGLMNEMKNFSANRDLIEIKKELPDEKIGNVNCYHFVAGLKENGLKELFKAILEKEKGSFSSEENTEEQAEKLAKQIGSLDIQYWVGKNDYLLRKIQTEAKILSSARESLFLGSITLSDFDRPVSVNVPAEYTDAEDLMKILTPLLQGAAK